ncbi:hypothetical protein CKAH01_04383 [Colletotrichum kahawae]|uniref:Uncharacterized protein n=1 Tax=Colletotrichum kahawae TaxID=34407 RepID=A0AAE0D8X9_COLKA|nr:hypothetical protein CKAH01_04383 [Colletotrichum kahawae]
MGRRPSDGFLFFALGKTRMVQGYGDIRGKCRGGSFFFLSPGKKREREKDDGRGEVDLGR